MTTVDITPAQADLLRAAMVSAERAQQELNLVFTAIVRGHHVEAATLVQLEGTTLTVTAGGHD